MSGGSYDYAYARVLDVAGSLRGRETNPLRRAFAQHLKLVSDAMHAIEWVDSCDYGPGDEDEAIRKVLAPGAELAAAIEMAEAAKKMLDNAIASARASDTSCTGEEGKSDG